jgi:ADP-ribosylglycohydrolase
VVSCFICLEFARHVIAGMDKTEAYSSLRSETPDLLESFGVSPEELRHFDRIFKRNIASLPSEQIASDGYVVHTLEAALWCVMKTSSYSRAVLKAVNLGRDTDTTAAVAGGLAGLLYGYETIPDEWMNVLARRKDIENLCLRLEVR